MKISLLFLFFLSPLFFLNAQSNFDKGQIITEIGGNTCNFLYKNSKGEKIENLYPQTSFSFETGYQRRWGKNGFKHAKITWNQYGVKGSNEKYNNYFEWQMQYLGICLGVEKELLKPSPYHLNLKFGAEPQFLIRGQQTINNQVSSLKGVEQFKNPFLFLKAGLGFSYCFDEFTAVSMRYMYGFGMPIGKSGDGESLRLSTHSVSIGLLVSLKRCDYCYSRKFKTSNSSI